MEVISKSRHYCIKRLVGREIVTEIRGQVRQSEVQVQVQVQGSR
jgi:hypothetical protein